MSDVNVTPDDWSIAPPAAALHRDALVWDNTLPWGDLGRPAVKAECLPRMTASGYDVVSLTVGGDRNGLSETIKKIAKERAYFLSHPDTFMLVETAADIPAAKTAGKLAVVFHFQGTNPVANDLNMVETYYRLGIRHMLMAYNLRNPVGDGCKEPKDAGLSLFGVKLVEEMNRVGMWVDCSHTGYRTSMDVFEVSSAPVIFSHTAAFAVHGHSRNIRDDQIRACARTGGVIGVNGVGTFLADNEGTAEAMLRHIDYIAEMVGPRHVGIGLDFVYDRATASPSLWNVVNEADPNARLPWPEINFTPPEELPRLTEAMMAHGYRETDIRAILGENWLRLAQRVWKP